MNFSYIGPIFLAIANFDDLVKSLKRRISVIPANPGSGPGQAPESSYFKHLKILWTPVFGELSRAVSTGVTTFYDSINFDYNALS
jgi:hypothetical protein